MDRRKRRRLLSALQSGILQEIRSISNTAIASFTGDGSDLVRLVVGIEPVQTGSGDPSPDNVRPISGWTECKVTRTGVNVWDEETEVGAISTTTGQNTSSTARLRTKNYIPVVPNTTYYSEAPNLMERFEYGEDKTFLRYVGGDERVKNWTVSNDCYYVRFCLYSSYGTTYNHNVMLNYPSTDTSYHAYVGTTYTIDLDGTRYGGTLDVTTGKLTVTHIGVNMGALSYTYQSLSGGRNAFYTVLDGVVPHASNDTAISAISSMYNAVSWSANWTNGIMAYSRDANGTGNKQEVTFVNNAYTDANTFKTAMDGQTIVYPLATPIEVDLTSTQIATLSGANNIWADTGDIILLEYMA